MPRRAHKKSRNGCLECKRRHVKCDESRPICSNCTASERVCEYGTRWFNTTPAPRPGPPTAAPTSGLGLGRGAGSSPGTATSIEPPSLSPASTEGGAGIGTGTASGNGTRSSIYTPSQTGLSDQPVNMLHVELFHNLYTNTYLTIDPGRFSPGLPGFLPYAVTTPYLVNEMLALSALHMSTLYPNKRDYYYYHAAQLQTHALAIFKDSNHQVTQETCTPLFLFASILGIHMLCDTLIYRDNDNDFDTFLSRFTHYLRLHYGVRTILREAWFLLRAADSIVKPALDVGMELYRFDGILDPTLRELLDRIIASKLGQDLTDLYRQVIESLQICTNITNSEDQRHAAVNGVIVWPILVRPEYGDALAARRPEALVILAHWAVLLWRYRETWLFGDSGVYILESVAGSLGTEWETWLEGPRRLIQDVQT
ncbi:hypothetical protein BDW67DRAFT_181462 [Aspergillus spinulosporus]